LCEVVERSGDIGMVRPKRLFADRQRTLIERLELGIIALIAIEFREVVERCADIGMVRPSAISMIARERR